MASVLNLNQTIASVSPVLQIQCDQIVVKALQSIDVPVEDLVIEGILIDGGCVADRAFVVIRHSNCHLPQLQPNGQIGGNRKDFEAEFHRSVGNGFPFCLVAPHFHSATAAVTSHALLKIFRLRQHVLSEYQKLISGLLSLLRIYPARYECRSEDRYNRHDCLHPRGPVDFRRGPWLGRMLAQQSPYQHCACDESHHRDDRPISIRASVLHSFSPVLKRILAPGVVR